MLQRSGTAWFLAALFAGFAVMPKTAQSASSGFLRTQDQKIVDAGGREVLLRCIGLGYWLLPEGYMWKFEGGGPKSRSGDRPRRVEKLISDLIGEKKAAEFWKEFRLNFITEADVQRMKELGFNSVRPALNARVFMTEEDPPRFLEANFKLLDRFIGWCGKHGLYVILDLHGAPGGQTGANIDDSPNDKPELFMDEKYRQRTIRLWKKLARRYRDNTTVAAYDLLNEPLPEKWKAYNPQLAEFHNRLIGEIREVDPHHMITIEGAHWSRDFSVFTAPIPPNVVLQFHKYWDENNQKAIQPYLDKRAQLNAPLWCGESGENKNDWYRASFKLLEDHNVGWCFWTWKKLGSDNNPYSIRPPKDWKVIQDYEKGGAKPDKAKAEAVLWEFLDNVKLKNCDFHPGPVEALFRKPVK